jgi:hypothetical protein
MALLTDGAANLEAARASSAALETVTIAITLLNVTLLSDHLGHCDLRLAFHVLLDMTMDRSKWKYL